MKIISLTDNENELIISALIAVINKYSEAAENYYDYGLDEIAAIFEYDCHKIIDIITKLR